MSVPAFCDNCGLVFESSIIEVGCVSEVTFEGNKIQCPLCKHMASIPDGVYKFVKNTIELISGSEVTRDKLNKLKEILINSKSNKFSFDIITENVNREAPELDFLLKKLKSLIPENQGNFYQFVIMLIYIIQLLTNNGSESGEQTVINENITVNQTINYIYEQERLKDKDGTTIKPLEISDINTTTPEIKVGRNELCQCGSGKKYKFCCLRLSEVVVGK